LSPPRLWCKLLTLQDIFAKENRRGNGDRRARGDDGRPRAGRRSGDRRKAVRYVGLGLFCLGLSVPAGAQIYTSRDASGHLVLSNRPIVTADPTFEVPRAASVRATRALAGPRSQLYDELIAEHARLNIVRPDLVRAVVQVESGFNTFARSPKGAAGLMQLMPATALRFGVKDPFNPVENVRAGVAYLRQLLDRYENNEQLALAAYNAGPGAVDKYGQNVPPYRETQDYVSRIKQIAPHPVQKLAARIYKTTDIVDGRPVPKYSNH
jgi:soluble lytic murein transglycosylase-like protein